jgi:putative cardiolipin synthase
MHLNDHMKIMMLVILVVFNLAFSLTAGASNFSSLIPYPFYAVQDGGQNQMTFLNDGPLAFAKRIDMVRRAQSHIEVEYFIYATDTTNRIFNKELIIAADRGVKIRILIDKSLPSFAFNGYFAKELKSHGIEVKYYNDAAIWRISTEQFRNHRKLISIDDLEAITGGRNMADEYFDFHHKFNFDDADLHVVGPIAKVMRETFDKFFEDEISVTPSYPTVPTLPDPLKRYKRRTAKAKWFFEQTDQKEIDARVRLDAALTGLAAQPSFACPTTTFSADAPGANFIARLKPDFIDTHRYLRKTLFDKISAIDKRITISSPYVIDGVNNDNVLNILLKNGAEIDLFTNSLGSTDAFYVAANMYLDLKGWMEKGIHVYLADGTYQAKTSPAPDYVLKAKSGTHAKVQVYETKTYSEVMVGTYNIDHRSNYYNAEMALFCKGSDELTAQIKQSISNNMKAGLTVSADAHSVTDKDGGVHSVYGASKAQVIKMKLWTFLAWLTVSLY